MVLVIGKIYSNNCGHCIDMKEAWDKFKGLMTYRRDVIFRDIEAENHQEAQIAAINRKFVKRGAPLALQGGYPTIFKIVHGRVFYYNGFNRTLTAFQQWVSRDLRHQHKHIKTRRGVVKPLPPSQQPQSKPGIFGNIPKLDKVFNIFGKRQGGGATRKKRVRFL